MIIGVTGGIGSGKTTVTDLFSELGINIVDTDLISRQVVEPGNQGLEAIVQKFGRNILQADGFLDRKQLRQIVFKQQQERVWLEELLHPLIFKATSEALESSSSPYTVLSSPLLLETADRNRVDRVLVVDVPLDIQLRRSMQRDQANEEQIKAIIAAQMSREERLKLADDVIDNSTSLESTRKQVLNLHSLYLSL